MQIVALISTKDIRMNEYASLNPAMIQSVDRYIKAKFNAFCVLEDFFENLALLIDREEQNPLDAKIEDLVTDMALESEEEIADFVTAYTDYINGIITLMNDFEKTEDPISLLKTKKDMIDTLFDTCAGGRQSLHAKIGEYASLIVETVFRNYAFDPEDYNSSDELLDAMKGRFDDIVLMSLVPLSELLVQINKEGKADEDQLVFAFGLSVLLAVCMDMINRSKDAQ